MQTSLDELVHPGQIEGRVTDKHSKDPLPGVTVVAARSIVTPAPVSENTITGDDGRYAISGLPPGDYIVSIYYGDRQFEILHVAVQTHRTSVVDWAFDQTAPAEQENRSRWTPVMRP